MKFGIVVVSLNPGNQITETLQSIVKQTYKGYEVIIKDGGSKDGTRETVDAFLKAAGEDFAGRVHFYEQKDKSIYDAMNQAVEYVNADYVLFLNCGDMFYDEKVLENIDKKLPSEKALIAYADTYFRATKSVAKAPERITASVCYRNIPCHQSIVYSKDCLSERPFDTSLKIRADYDHFLDAFFIGHRKFVYLDMIIADYEGGGFSEKKSNKKLDSREYSVTVRKYIPLWERFKNRALLILTLHKLRGTLSRSKRFAGIYQKVKDKVVR